MKKYFDFWNYINETDEGYKKTYTRLFESLGVRMDLVWRNAIVICTTEYFEKLGVLLNTLILMISIRKAVIGKKVFWIISAR